MMSGPPPDYVDVATRIAVARVNYPDGRLRPVNPEKPYTIEILDGQTYIVVVTAFYRTPDDPLPGIGMAYEVFPGKTNFTRGSELMNCETSSWGRALVAAFVADTKRGGVSSADEIRNRREEQTFPRKPDPMEKVRERLRTIAQDKGIELAGEYHVWSQGASITDAKLPELTAFANSLAPEPTRRVSRSTQ